MDETTNLNGLIESAKLTGRIDLLMELKEWLDKQISDAEQKNERLREEAKV